MKRWSFDVPEGPGELLQIPPLREWPLVVKRRGLAADRHDLLRRARDFASLYNLSVQEGESGLLIMSGHQPGFVHPGVWVKQFVLDGMAEALDATAVHLQVDTDLPPALAPPVLTANGDRDRIEYFEPPGGKPFETLTAPGRIEWDAFLRRLREASSPALHPGLDRLEEAAHETWSLLGPEPGLGLFLDTLRRHYEKPRRYFELPISQLCGSTGFLYFVAEVLQHIESFHRAYNGRLVQYRSERKVRSKANPMPDLRHRADAVEAPFWILDRQGVRRGLWMQPDGTLLAREVPMGRFDGTVESLAGLSLRPRALTLTMYCRRYLCDIFIHGVGGARYDTITDGIFEDFWGMLPPPYACISLSLPPSLGGAAPVAPDLRATRRQVRDLTWNPQRWTPSPAKDALIRQISETPPARQHPLAEQIRALNHQLSEQLAATRTALEETLAAQQRALESYRIQTARDYPYFFFDPDELRRIVAPALPVKLPNLPG